MQRDSRTHARYSTAAPPLPPPEIACPACGAGLTYLYSYVGGVNARRSEQWDQFSCPEQCGWFEYRQRTGRLRPID